MTVDFSTCLLTKCYTYSLVCVKCLPTMYGGVLYFLWSHLNLALVRYLLFGVLRLFAASIFEVNQCRNLFSPQNRIYMYIFYPRPEILTLLGGLLRKIHFHHFVQKCGTEAGTKCASFSVGPLFSIIDFTHVPIVQVMFLSLTPHVEPLCRDVWLVCTFSISPEHCGPST